MALGWAYAKEHMAPSLVLSPSRCLTGHVVDFRESPSQYMPTKGPGAQDPHMLICTSHQPARPHLAVCRAEAMGQPAQAAQVPLEASQLSA